MRGGRPRGAPLWEGVVVLGDQCRGEQSRDNGKGGKRDEARCIAVHIRGGPSAPGYALTARPHPRRVKGPPASYSRESKGCVMAAKG